MVAHRTRIIVAALLIIPLVAGCGRLGGSLGGSLGGGGDVSVSPSAASEPGTIEDRGRERLETGGSSIWDIFRPSDEGQIVSVNRYIWNASLETLSFLPIQSIDPFTGVIVTGYGTPPGGGRAYRATVYISDPALEARSLNVAMQTRSGPVAASTQRAVEDAILARARQLRSEASRF